MPKHKAQPKAADATQSAPDPATTPEQRLVSSHVETTPHSIVLYDDADNGLAFHETITEAQVIDLAREIGKRVSGIGWKIGDIANYCKAKFGHKDYDRLAEESGFAEVYLRTCSSVASYVPLAMRGAMSMERWRLVMALPNQKKLVPLEGGGKSEQWETPTEKAARSSGWTYAELRAKKQATPQLPAGDSTETGASSAGAAEGPDVVTTTPPTGKTGASAGSATDSGTTDGKASPTGAASGGAAGNAGKTPDVWTADKLFIAMKLLLKALENIDANKVTLLAVYDRNARTPDDVKTIGRLSAMLKGLSEQVDVADKADGAK
jgi:hypothetical protein